MAAASCEHWNIGSRWDRGPGMVSGGWDRGQGMVRGGWAGGYLVADWQGCSRAWQKSFKRWFKLSHVKNAVQCGRGEF